MYNSLTLAYLGDAVLELLVREKLLLVGNNTVKDLHKQALKFVCAKAQSDGVEKLIPYLTDEEFKIYKRGRNAKSTAPKSADVTDYKRATGLEALFGYLYLVGEQERMYKLFEISFA